MGKGKSIYFDRGSGQFVGMDEAKVKELSEIYPGVNVSAEIKRMSEWLMSSKGRHRRGTIAFILKWLGNEEPKPATKEMEADEVLKPLILGYLEELWMGRQHILELNKIRRKK